MSIEIRDQTIFIASGGTFQVRYTITHGDQRMTRSDWRISAIEAVQRATELSSQACVSDVSVHEHWNVPTSRRIGTAAGGAFTLTGPETESCPTK